MRKLIGWIAINFVTILGITQVIIKLLKELLTGIVNLLFPLIPSDKFQDVVMGVRNFVNKADKFIEKIKNFFVRTAA